MCDHLAFNAQVAIHRLEDTQDGDSLACMVDVHAQCAACHHPLLFALPLGVNLLHGATMGTDGTEARLVARIGIPRQPGGPTHFRVPTPEDIGL